MGSVVAIPVAFVTSLAMLKPSDFIFWCKWLISYVCIQISKKSMKKRFDLYDIQADHDPVKLGFISAPQECLLETPLEENELSVSEDEIFFYGVNSKNEGLTVQLSRRCNNKADTFILLKLSNGKVYQLKEQNGFQRSCCEKKSFTCGGLQVHYITPMRKWRIYFNGLLKETDEDESSSEKIVHVKFALLWRASSDVFDFWNDIDANSLARSLATTKWRKFFPSLEQIKEALNFYAQSGIIMGTVKIEGEEEEREIYLFGERKRFLGKTSLVGNLDIWNASFYALKDGSFIHLCEISLKDVVNKLKFGFLVYPMGFMSVVVDFNLLPKENKIQFSTKDTMYELEGNFLDKCIRLKNKNNPKELIAVERVSAEYNSQKCYGIVMKRFLSKQITKENTKVSLSRNPTVRPLVVPFSDDLCQDSTLTGGKGSSLGVLTELSKEIQTFIVPSGFVVTTTAYEEFITKDVLEKIKQLEEVLYRSESSDIKEPCQRVMDETIKSDIPQKLREVVENSLSNNFSEKGIPQYAVRSSATGEDTEQMSAAGQMETFLGVVGLDDILLAMKKCWASQFSHIAVQYKRQNGQIINSPMAVVIQRMIPCDVAGVLFTCDPLTGNPSIISITANYGLGESVVSASEDPDIIELKRDFPDNLSINNKSLGAKNRRIVLKEDTGTNVEEISEKEREVSCLTDEKALRLGNLAIKIEKSYRSHRDIEWGFWNNNLYIFQSRPVTSGAGETDFEIDHEMDAPMRVENEIFTVCNVGEVMPGAMPAMSWDVLHKYFRSGMEKRASSDFQSPFKPKYFPRSLTSMCGHVVFYCVDFLEQMNGDKETIAAALASLFGRAVEDDDLMEAARLRFGDVRKDFKGSGFSFFFSFSALIIRILNTKSVLNKTLKVYSNYRIPIENLKKAQETFDVLLYSCSDLSEAMLCHMRNSAASSLWNMFILNILRKARGGMDASLYSDFSELLKTKCDVESADVPAGIELLASCIAKEIKPEEFKKMKKQEAIEWLENSQTEAALNYKDFLRKHGHRCLREFDIRSKTWKEDPTTLIQLLQNLVGNTTKSYKKEDNSGKILSELNINFPTRLLLKFLIKRSHYGVQYREASKSLLIKAEDAWRQGYRHLAKLLVLEGRIPNEDIFYFMTLDEIKELLDTRSPRIIARANRRKRRYPVVDKYIFPELMKGFPRPINLEEAPIVNSEENLCMKGTPVSQGVVKAFVRVAITLEEAGHLQPGEILVTYSTDIGWSPYFPMLSGVVTELGGHISHGAVVSREYGLPCITSLHGATRQFKTGDYALLDGNKGILQRLPKPENSENI